MAADWVDRGLGPGAKDVDRLEGWVVESFQVSGFSQQSILGQVYPAPVAGRELCQSGLGAVGTPVAMHTPSAPGYVFWTPYALPLPRTRTSWAGLGLCLPPGNAIEAGPIGLGFTTLQESPRSGQCQAT